MASVIRGSSNFDSDISRGLGDGQTWQDMTASRASGVTYTNTTGRSITINITTTATTANLVVDGVILQTSGSNAAVYYGSLTGVIPNNSVYYITGGPTTWTELR